MPTPPNTVAQLSHAMVIRASGAGGNATIGAVNQWSPRHDRALQDLHEFGQTTAAPFGRYAQNPGEPFEVVPGNITGMQIDVARWDLYVDQMETAFLTPDLTMLSNQFDSFTLREIWTAPAATNNYAKLYQGAWFGNIGRTIDAKGDRSINVNAQIRYNRIDKVDVAATDVQ